MQPLRQSAGPCPARLCSVVPRASPIPGPPVALGVGMMRSPTPWGLVMTQQNPEDSWGDLHPFPGAVLTQDRKQGRQKQQRCTVAPSGGRGSKVTVWQGRAGLGGLLPLGLSGPTFPLFIRMPIISGEGPPFSNRTSSQSYVIRATYLLEVPRWSSGWDFVLSLQGACVQFQVGGLRLCMLVS